MRDTANAAKVGLFVLLILGGTWATWRLVDENAGSDGYSLYAMFEDAQGLVPKSRVVVAGIQVGSIERIALQGARARIDLRIDEGIDLYRDAALTKRQTSILGESILVIHPGSPPAPKLEDGERIQVASEGTGTDAIMNDVAEITKSVKAVSRQLERAFGTDQAGDDMESALKNLSDALAAVNRTIQQNEEVVARTLRNVEGITDEAGPRIATILENVEVTTRDLRGIIGNNREGLENAGGRIDDTVASINRASHELEEVMGDIHEISGRTARGEGTIGRLTTDETLIDEVEGVVEDVGDVVSGIARLQTIVELRSEYNFLANTFKNYVSLRLQPREDRYYLIQLINDPRGLTEFTQTEVRTSPPPADTPPYYQETRITTRDALRFSLMFAKRIEFATFRFGILESTGGLGVDFHVLDDQLELTADVFAFGEQAYPRLRVRAAYEFLQRFWVLAGVDDALNDSNDFFLGGMLRFNDEDLKSILPFVGTSAAGSGG